MKKVLLFAILFVAMISFRSVKVYPIVSAEIYEYGSVGVWIGHLSPPPVRKLLKINMTYSNGTDSYTVYYNVGIQIAPGQQTVEIDEDYDDGNYHFQSYEIVSYTNFYN